MKIKGVMNNVPFSFEHSLVEAIDKLCVLFLYDNPKVIEEDGKVIVTNEGGTVLFEGAPEEMSLFLDASKMIVEKHRMISGTCDDGLPPSSAMLDDRLSVLSQKIAKGLDFRERCAPKASLAEAMVIVGA